MAGNFSFQYANLERSRTVMTVRRSNRTLMFGCNSFSAFFLRAMVISNSCVKSCTHQKNTSQLNFVACCA